LHPSKPKGRFEYNSIGTVDLVKETSKLRSPASAIIKESTKDEQNSKIVIKIPKFVDDTT
jgi:hypothetical protein